MISKFSLPDEITKAIQSVVGCNQTVLHEPTFIGNEWNYLKQCLDSTLVSSIGPFVDQFESELCRYTGAKYAIAVVNGTAGLHIALKLSGVKPGDEVLIPALTFVATANAVSYCQAIPHFVDSSINTLGMDASKLRDYLLTISEQRNGLCINIATGRVIRAIVPMHTFGHPVDINEILGIANDFNLMLIEDAAESLGSFYCGKHTGTFGLMGVLSFNGNKIITTGGGGAILTNNESIAKSAKHITTTAKLKHPWEYRHDSVAYNYRLPNINAALGCAQLEQLPILISAKRELYQRYKEAFKLLSDVILFEEPNNCKSNYWLQAILLNPICIVNIADVLNITNANGIMTRPAWTLISDLAPYSKFPQMNLNTAKQISNRLINIPSSSNLTLNNE